MNPLRWSHLRHMAQSPAHYRHAVDVGFPETPAMRFGSLVHRLVLGSDRELAVYGGQRRGKVWEAFRDAHRGAEIVTADEYDRAAAVAEAVLSHGPALDLIDGAVKERQLTWGINGRACTGRPDLIAPDYIADLKVTATAHPDRFKWQANRMRWPGQLCWYAEGAERAGVAGGASLYLIAVEPKPPCPVAVYYLTEADREMGRKMWRGPFEQLMSCEASGQWPGYAQVPLPLDVAQDELSLVIDGEEVEL